MNPVANAMSNPMTTASHSGSKGAAGTSTPAGTSVDALDEQQRTEAGSAFGHLIQQVMATENHLPRSEMAQLNGSDVTDQNVSMEASISAVEANSLLNGGQTLPHWPDSIGASVLTSEQLPPDQLSSLEETDMGGVSTMFQGNKNQSTSAMASMLMRPAHLSSLQPEAEAVAQLDLAAELSIEPDAELPDFQSVLGQLDKAAERLDKTTGAAPTLRMDRQLSDPGWRDQLSERLLMVTSSRLSSAEIQLDPPELGQLMVKVQYQGDQASVTISSPHASVRESVDLSLDRLRELFAESGVNLADVNVSDQSAQQQSEEGFGENGESETHDTEGVTEQETPMLQVSNRLIDTTA